MYYQMICEQEVAWHAQVYVARKKFVLRVVSRENANLSGSKKGHSLESLNRCKGKYNNLDQRKSAITEKSYDIF